MLYGPAFINDTGHKKTLKIITMAVDFGFPTIKIFLRRKKRNTVCIIEILHNLHINTRNFVIV